MPLTENVWGAHTVPVAAGYDIVLFVQIVDALFGASEVCICNPYI